MGFIPHKTMPMSVSVRRAAHCLLVCSIGPAPKAAEEVIAKAGYLDRERSAIQAMAGLMRAQIRFSAI